MLAGAALALGGGAIGFLLGRSSGPPPSARQAVPEVRVDPPDLAPILDEMRRVESDVLAALREVRSSEPPASATREPVRPDDRLDQIAATVEQIAKRLDEEIQLQGKGRGYSTLDEVRKEFQLQEAGLQSVEAIRSSLRAAHVRWSYRDVRDRYGTPFSDEYFADGGNGGVTYDLGAAFLTFSLTDGDVWDVRLIAKDR